MSACVRACVREWVREGEKRPLRTHGTALTDEASHDRVALLQGLCALGRVEHQPLDRLNFLSILLQR